MPSDCINWVGATSQGYGHVRIKGQDFKAHRLAYIKAKGPIPPGMFVCHSCDNRLCVNPDHLWVGTRRDNAIDAITKGRWNRPRGEKHRNAKLTTRQVHVIRHAVRFGVTQRFLAGCFNVSKTAIRFAAIGKSWQYI
jgi:hypothetical protein